MGIYHSHDFTRTHDYNGLVTVHHERIKRNPFGLTMTYIRTGDCINQKIIIKRIGQHKYHLVQIFSSDVKYEMTLMREEIIKLLSESELQERVGFMTEYIRKYSY